MTEFRTNYAWYAVLIALLYMTSFIGAASARTGAGYSDTFKRIYDTVNSTHDPLVIFLFILIMPVIVCGLCVGYALYFIQPNMAFMVLEISQYPIMWLLVASVTLVVYDLSQYIFSLRWVGILHVCNYIMHGREKEEGKDGIV